MADGTLLTRGAGPSGRDRPEGERSVVREAMIRFVVLGAVCLVVAGLLTVLLAGSVARSIATREAEVRTLSFATAVAGPTLDAATRRRAEGPLVQALNNRLLDDSIVHAAIYDTDGRVVWSADPGAIGTTEELSDEVRQLLGGQDTVAEYSVETHAGSSGQEEEMVVLEVYATAIGADGVPFVLEWYWPTSHLEANERQLMRLLLPLTLGSLLLFALMILPLTLATARRVEKDRTRLTQHALNASKIERRRLSEDLHDGVVQDLSGIGYVLPMVGKDLPEDSVGHAVLAQIRTSMQRNISAIRGLIAEIRPIDMRGNGFREAMDGLVSRMGEQGVETTVTLTGDLDVLGPTARSLVYRIAREGLRNVLRHSGAQHAWVEVRQQSSLVHVLVRDDGVGPTGERAARPSDDPEDSHFGLDLLREAVSDLDGELALRPGSGGGTELAVSFRHDHVLT
ncbi:histidine kinase [Ornithinimicrobium cerasi]|uniref:sensor histidine kinase n=1 Tax=Ornithinimicrobium cerasi TaxID=2248773 RepID=UPI000F0033F6|nr:histidine kinase [Ornithinimicrobium cerasi]